MQVGDRYNHIDIRSRKRMESIRRILKMRLQLLDKDIGSVKFHQAIKAIDELSLKQLEKLHKTALSVDIVEKILTEFANTK